MRRKEENRRRLAGSVGINQPEEEKAWKSEERRAWKREEVRALWRGE